MSGFFFCCYRIAPADGRSITSRRRLLLLGLYGNARLASCWPTFVAFALRKPAEDDVAFLSKFLVLPDHIVSAQEALAMMDSRQEGTREPLT